MVSAADIYVPSWHLAHVVKPLDVLNVPEGHLAHMEEPANLAKVPSTQSEHTAEEVLEPAQLTYLPDGHASHAVWALMPMYWPGAHFSHGWSRPTAVLNVPTSQSEQCSR